MSRLQQLPSEILILIFEANLGHLTSFDEIYAIWLSSHCLYYRFNKDFMINLFLQHLEHGLAETGNGAGQWEHARLAGLFRLVVDSCQNDDPEFLQRAATRYPDLFDPLASLELRFHLNSPCSSPWRGSFDHAPSMLHSLLLVEYAILMDAPLTAQLLLSHRASVEKHRWRMPCKSYYLRLLVKAVMASEDLDEGRADAALLSAHRFGLPRTGVLVMSVIALGEKGNWGVDPGSGPASESHGSPSPRNRLLPIPMLPQPREVAARDLVSGLPCLLQSMKAKRDFTLYHTDLPVAAQRTTANPKKLITPLTLRWIELTSHEKLIRGPDKVPSIGGSSPSPGDDLASDDPRAGIDCSPRASGPVCGSRSR
ncbi:hypothetical protein QBC41DRAFT_302142 [Cercophora samala]|uniref:Uncharacterized protein n=1 Tax=Cercophora samala TaxID=330535 RepID=A0AA39ZF92_9PEZI|nr:hypothetical protein QBC41DRAFT_302142 [Cercophora samala]